MGCGRSDPRDPDARGSVAKRALDVALAATQLLVTLPSGSSVPLAIKLEDGDPVFYGQRRVGRGGRLFTSWKFRSMTPGTEDDDAPLKQAGLEARRVTEFVRGGGSICSTSRTTPISARRSP